MRQPKLSSLDRWHCLAAWGDRAKVPEEAGLAQIPRSPSRLKRSAPTKGWPQGASSAPSAGLSKPSRPASTIRVGFTFFQR